MASAEVLYNLSANLFLKNYVTSERAISHNFVSNQQLSIAHLVFMLTIILSNDQ